MKRRAGRTKKARLALSAPVSKPSQDARRRALDALSLMRSKGLPLARAAREALTTPRTVTRYAGSALFKKPSGRYEAKLSDRLARSLRFLTPEGQISVTVRSSRTASKIGEYWAAVDQYLRTGDTARLDQFRSKSVRVGKAAFPFITDLRVLNQIASAGEVSFEDIYSTTA